MTLCQLGDSCLFWQFEYESHPFLIGQSRNQFPSIKSFFLLHHLISVFRLLFFVRISNISDIILWNRWIPLILTRLSRISAYDLKTVCSLKWSNSFLSKAILQENQILLIAARMIYVWVIIVISSLLWKRDVMYNNLIQRSRDYSPWNRQKPIRLPNRRCRKSRRLIHQIPPV